MKKSFSEQVCAWCIIAAIVTIFAECAMAQTVEHRPQKQDPFLKWNKAEIFKDKPALKFFDWGSYTETWDLKQVTLWSMFAGSGAMWGAREAYHADPFVFEKVHGAGGTESIALNVDWTDEGNTARSAAIPILRIGVGAFLNATLGAAGAVPYPSTSLEIRCKASTAITVKTSGTFTGTTYNVEGRIKKI